MRGALLAGGGLGAGDDVGVVAAHEVAAHLRLLLLQDLVQRPLACSRRTISGSPLQGHVHWRETRFALSQDPPAERRCRHLRRQP